MRTFLILAAFASLAACADAPITAADLQANGELRDQTASSQQSIHAASETTRPKVQTAEQLRVTGLLAPQADGPLEDATHFSLEAEAIYLHLRADGLDEPRPVTYVWSHGQQQRETMGFVQPRETISLAASLPLVDFVEAAEEAAAAAAKSEDAPEAPVLTGSWRVEVYSTDANGRSLVFAREFEVLEAELFEAEAALSAAVDAAVDASGAT